MNTKGNLSKNDSQQKCIKQKISLQYWHLCRHSEANLQCTTKKLIDFLVKLSGCKYTKGDLSKNDNQQKCIKQKGSL